MRITHNCLIFTVKFCAISTNLPKLNKVCQMVLIALANGGKRRLLTIVTNQFRRAICRF